MIPGTDLVDTKTELCRRVGCSRPTLDRWLQHPESPGANERGLYSVDAWCRWASWQRGWLAPADRGQADLRDAPNQLSLGGRIAALHEAVFDLTAQFRKQARRLARELPGALVGLDEKAARRKVREALQPVEATLGRLQDELDTGLYR